MNRSRIIKSEIITTGSRLKELINQKGFMYQKDFVEDFANWKDLQPKYNSVKHSPDAKDISRYISGEVKHPSKIRIQMFADYFGVDFEYLNCTQLNPVEKKRKKNRKSKKDSAALEKQDVSMNEISQWERKDKIIDFLRFIGYKISVSPTSSCAEAATYKVLKQKGDDALLLTIEQENDVMDGYEIEIEYPDGAVQKLNDDEMNNAFENITDFIDFTMNKLKKG
ncbi:MAG: hypothetical protein WCG21_10755 [Eubacteriales bacterium]